MCVASSLAALVLSFTSVPCRRCWLKDLRGVYQYCNAAFAADCGLAESKVVGRSTEEIWPENWREIREVDCRLASGGVRDAISAEHNLVIAGGAVPVNVIRWPVAGADGKVTGVVGYYDLGQSEAHRAAEVQLILALVPPECRERISAGLDALAEEFTS